MADRWHPVPIPPRFWPRVAKGPDCWIWTGARRSPGGYGTIRGNGHQLLAHRVAYELAIGPIPEGKQLDHLCRNKGCVNPAHLEPVTNRENVLRGVGPSAVNARKTHCVNGHEFTPENTYREKGGGRACKACGRDRMRASYRPARSALGAPK